MDQPVEGLSAPGAVPHGHLQSVDGQIGPQAVGDLPAHHQATEHVDDERGVDPAAMGLHIGQVGHPQPVRGRRLEPAADQIIGAALAVVVAGGDLEPPAPPRAR